MLLLFVFRFIRLLLSGHQAVAIENAALRTSSVSTKTEALAADDLGPGILDHSPHPVVHLVNSDLAENGKLEQALSNCGSVCLLRVSRRFFAQPSRSANRNPRAPSSTQRASALRQTPTLERGRPLALGAFIS